VTDACHPRHTHAEFLAFLKQVAKAYPRVQLHIVCDNYGTHKHPAVKTWLAKNPRITMHFTPTSDPIRIPDARVAGRHPPRRLDRPGQTGHDPPR
jgi:hypothetical protein